MQKLLLGLIVVAAIAGLTYVLLPADAPVDESAVTQSESPVESEAETPPAELAAPGRPLESTSSSEALRTEAIEGGRDAVMAEST
ncbi:MAG: hypothetical protein AAFZ65_21195, partial [Planctomycetota bacterium]